MSRMKWTTVFLAVIAGLSAVVAAGEEPVGESKPNLSATEKQVPKKVHLMTLIVTPPEGWFSKKHKIPGNPREVLSMSKTEEAGREGGFGIFRHSGFRTVPYTPEGIMAVDIQSFSLGGLPFKTKDVKVGTENRDAKWVGYTTEGKTTDLVFVKHENNVYRLSGTYPKDDKATQTLFWEMVKTTEFVEKSNK
jgi:hypothetical protein